MIVLLTSLLLILTRLITVAQDRRRYGDVLPLWLMVWPLLAPVVLSAAALLLPPELAQAPVTRPVAYGLVTVVVAEELALALLRSRWQDRQDNTRRDA